MYLDELPNELLFHIFHSAATVHDALSLASTNHRLHALFASQKLPILFQAAEAQYGPLSSAIQLATYNDSQPAHRPRHDVPYSLALLRQILSVGAVASRWEHLYPPHKWSHDFENRRVLTPAEAFRLRRAVYRLWLYARAFHTAAHPRTRRTLRPDVLARAALLRVWSAAELAEAEDLRAVLRAVVAHQLCPSNGTVRRRFRRRFPDADSAGTAAAAGLNIHLNYPPRTTAAADATFRAHFYCAHPAPATTAAKTTVPRYGASSSLGAGAAWLEPDPAAEGWGDEIPHYYVVEDMLKLDPAQILWLREHASCKAQVEAYVKGLGEWFENNGETFGQTLEFVLDERGEEVGEMMEAIGERRLGIVRE